MSPDSSPIRVAQVVRPAEGGIRRHVSLLIGELDPSRFSSALYAPDEFTLEEPNPRVTRAVVDIAARTSIPRDLRAIRALAAILNDRFDLVHAHGLRAAVVGVIAARRANIPALFTAHNLPESLSAMQRYFLKLLSRRSDVIAVSEAVSKSLQAIGVDESRIHVIPNGIRLNDYASTPTTDRAQLGIDFASDGPLLAYIGRLSPEKGLDTLLDAYEMVTARKPNTHLLVIGSGPDEAKLKSRASRLTGIRFLGRRTDVPQLLRCADLVVVPSYTEGQGIVAIEAMASGLPVVASNVGGLAETVVDGETGILAPPHDSRALADGLLAILDDPIRASSMGEAGKKRALAKYSVVRMIEEIQHLYFDICKTR